LHKRLRRFNEEAEGMKLTGIVAYNKHFVIADKLGKIPWHIKDDLNFFKQTTVGHPVIMGRLTWESLPDNFRPLPKRYNIVISKSVNSLGCDAIATSIEEAVSLAMSQPNITEAFVIGGAQIYQKFVDSKLLDRVLASEVKGYDEVDGSCFFPDLRNLGWQSKTLLLYPEFSVIEFRQ
jgi:dihydrofolate reductase